MKKLKIGKSKIHGKGLFSGEPIKKGELIAKVHSGIQMDPETIKYMPTQYGRFYNHDEKGFNTRNEIIGNHRYLRAIKAIPANTELTANYREHAEMEQPEDFGKGKYASFDFDKTIATDEGLEKARQMLRDGYNLFIISARDKVTPDMVSRARKAGIPEENIIATGSDEAKVRKVKQLGVEMHFDDKPEVISELGLVGRQFKKGGGVNSKKYTRSIFGKNKLFVKNKLFKTKKVKNRIYDPNAKYFDNGGTVTEGEPLTENQLALQNFVYPNSQVECDDDGRCYETDQIQEMLDRGRSIPGDVLDVAWDVIYEVNPEEGPGISAATAWKNRGVQTLAKRLGMSNPANCMWAAGSGWQCMPEFENVPKTAFESNDKFISAVNKGTVPFTRVTKTSDPSFDSKEKGILKEGDIINVKGPNTSHAMTFSHYREDGTPIYVDSNGNAVDFDFNVGMWSGMKPGNGRTAYVSRFSPDMLYGDKIRELEEKARTNPTYYTTDDQTSVPTGYRMGGFPTDISIPELNQFDNGGTYYTVPGSNGVYRKVNGKWEVDWNKSGSFQPITKGDVAKRIAAIEKGKTQYFDKDYGDLVSSKSAKYQSIPKPQTSKPTAAQTKAQQNFDKNFKVTDKSKYEKVEDKIQKDIQEYKNYMQAKGETVPIDTNFDDMVKRGWESYGNVKPWWRADPTDQMKASNPAPTGVERMWEYATNPLTAFEYAVSGGGAENMPYNINEMRMAGIDPGVVPGRNLVGNAANMFNLVDAGDKVVRNTAEGNYGTAALEAMRFIPGARATTGASKSLVSGSKNLYNKVATGNSPLPIAWKMEKGLDNPLTSIKNTKSFTDDQARVLNMYLENPYSVVRGTEDSKILDDLVKNTSADLRNINEPVTKILDYYVSSGANPKIAGNYGETITFPGNRSWSVGAGRVSGYEGKKRLVVPSKYSKDLDFTAVPYDDPRLTFNNPEERELLGNVPEGYKVIGKSKEDGFENIFIKPIKKQNGGDVLLDKTEFGGVTRKLKRKNNGGPTAKVEEPPEGTTPAPTLTEAQQWITDWYKNRKIAFPEDDPRFAKEMMKILPSYNPESAIINNTTVFPQYIDDPSLGELNPEGLNIGAAGTYEETKEGPIIRLNPALNPTQRLDTEIHELTNYMMSPVRDKAYPIQNRIVEQNIIPFNEDWTQEQQDFYDYVIDPNEQNIQSYLNVARKNFGLKADEVITPERIQQIKQQAEEKGMLDHSNPNFNPDIYMLLKMGKDDEGLSNLFNYIAKNDSKDTYDQPMNYGKLGGAYRMGDQVDESTMRKLKKLGYTFQKI